MSPRVVETLLFATTTLACVSTPSFEPPSTPVHTSPAQPQATAPETTQPQATATLDAKTARTHAGEILTAVAHSRALTAARTLAVDVVDRDGIRAYAKRSIYEDITPAQLQMLAEIDASLGVLPLGVHGETVLLDTLERGVVGFYDPKAKTLYIGDFVPPPMLSMVVGHEIAHGLQDMHFDLDALKKPRHHDSDGDVARTFLVEGDAQAAYLAWTAGTDGLAAVSDAVLHELGDMALTTDDGSPYPILMRSLLLPYAEGTATIVRLVQRDGWSAVDALYDHLPTTSEQMLHIDKLDAREPAIDITLDWPALAKTGSFAAKPTWHDNLGEAALLAMLAQVEPPGRARAAAAGWGGDHYYVFEAADAAIASRVPSVHGLIVWDSAADAEQFVASFRKYLRKQMGDDFALERRAHEVAFATRVAAASVNTHRALDILFRGHGAMKGTSD